MKSYINLLTGVISLFSILSSGSALMGQNIKVSAVSDLVRVFEDGYNLPPLTDTVKAFGIRGEIISAQFVINSRNNLSNTVVEVTPLNGSNGSALPVQNIEWNFVGSVPVQKNVSNQLKTTVSRIAPARFPDYLMAERQINISKNTWQPVWLTINIPENASPGEYTGMIKIKAGQVGQDLPLKLTIFPLTMPVKRHLKITEWYNTAGFSKIHGIKEQYSDEWFAMLKKYADNMAAHRQNVFQVPFNAIEIRRMKNGELQCDFTRFDQIAQVFWDTRKMDILETGELAKFEKNWYSTKIVIKDFSVTDTETGTKITLPGTEVIPQILPPFERHLREKGWLNKTVFHVKDEPTLHNAASYLEMCEYMHRYAPDLIRIDAINSPYVLDGLEIGVSMLDNLGILYDGFKKKQEQGIELWFYTTGQFQADGYPNKTIDMPLIDTRLMHWINYRYNIDGYLHWGWNQWTDDPFTNVSEHNGDGWHVYPAKDGVLNSLRWEQMRNGIQDYEYFWLLESRIQALKDSLGSKFSWIDPEWRGKEIAGNIILSFAEHNDDPAALYNIKRKLINEILEFDRGPGLYVQMHPFENTILKSRSTIEVIGWVEPGTKIDVNGKDVPVSSDGLFMEAFSIYPGKSTMKVTATGSKGSKTIVHNYTIN